ncbi:MAG: secretion protein HlyD [Peptococcaceae bacterium BICA1-7]|nr:MAG: secretion protein HlyD [Peptococcaceae bacterium BICA1-7]HBV96547.1 secretion protein HlyD [Desulfotomaculum sp.]
MKKKVAAMLILILVAAVSYYGYHRYRDGDSNGIQASGTIEATEVNLTARLPGTLEFVSVKAGDEVKKGQVVSKIIRTDLLSQKERDALGVQKAEAQLNDLASGARVQEIAEARAAEGTARANYDRANTDYSRAEQLLQGGAISQADFEKAETALQIAKSQLDSARARLALLESGSRPDQVEAARIELERSRTILAATQSLLEDTNIASPIDGTVATRNYEPGEFVSTGAAVATVSDLKDLWIRVYISTDDLPAIRLGQEVSFTVSGTPDIFKGTVMEIASKGEYTPKMIQTKQERTNTVYAVKIKIDNSQGVFKPGMPADVIFR